MTETTYRDPDVVCRRCGKPVVGVRFAGAEHAECYWPKHPELNNENIVERFLKDLKGWRTRFCDEALDCKIAEDPYDWRPREVKKILDQIESHPRLQEVLQAGQYRSWSYFVDLLFQEHMDYPWPDDVTLSVWLLNESNRINVRPFIPYCCC